MKKTLFILAAAVLALASCGNDNKQGTDPVKDAITLKGSDVVDLEENNFYTVEFNATTDWTAELLFPEAGEPYASLDVMEGKKGDAKVKLTVESLEEGTGRFFMLYLTAGEATATIFFMQGKVLECSPIEGSAPFSVEGGMLKLRVLTNCEVTYTKYDGEGQSFPWAPVTIDEAAKTITINAQKNDSYDARQGYVKITTSEIQEPVIDEETGEPTGATKDYSLRFYFDQAGVAAAAWQKDLDPTEFIGNASYTVALWNGNLVLCNGEKLFAFNPENGEFLGEVAVPTAINGITNDSEGNVVAYLKAVWSEDPSVAFPLTVIAIKKGEEVANATLLFSKGDDFYGYGLDNLRVNGDVFGNACIDAFSAAGYEGGSYMVSYAIEEGKYISDGNYTDYVNLPWADAMWSTRAAVGMHLGNTVDSGILYIGYDGNYNLHYNAGMASANWQEVLATGSSWAEGYDALDIIEWNGKTYAAFIGYAYFPHWGMPSYLWVVDVTDPTQPVAISSGEYYGSAWAADTEADPTYVSTDLTLAIEDGNLVVYLYDASWCTLMKKVFPVL